MTRFLLIFGLLGVLLLIRPAAAAEDYYYHQVFNMGGKGLLSIVDFHYNTQRECEDAVKTMRRMMVAKHSTWQQTSGTCSQKLSSLYKALMANARVDAPYLTFQDMRQWVDGVSQASAVKFCQTAAAEPRFKGQARCVQ